MNTMTLIPSSLNQSVKPAAPSPDEAGISAVVHELKNHASTIALGIAALKYPDETEAERQHHLAALEAVVAQMNRQFQRLDDWLMDAGYKRKPGKSNGVRLRKQAL